MPLLTGYALAGVPAAFSPSCSENHIPGYINSPKLKDAGKVFVVSVNDPFVYVPQSNSLQLRDGGKCVGD
jgi:peroxiredoxin